MDVGCREYNWNGKSIGEGTVDLNKNLMRGLRGRTVEIVVIRRVLIEYPPSLQLLRQGWGLRRRGPP